MAYIDNAVENGTVRTPEKESDEDILARLNNYVREAIAHRVNAEWRDYAIAAFRYEEGDQIDAVVRRELELRGQPIVIENRLRPKRKQFMGTYERLRLKAAFTGRNIPMDEAEAAALNDLNRYVDQESEFFNEEAEAVKDMFIAGMGWLERAQRQGNDGKPRLFTRYVDPFEMFADPFGRRQDLEDYRYLIRGGRWIDLDVAIANWPDKESELLDCIGMTETRTGLNSLPETPWTSENEMLYVDAQRSRIRPWEVWYRRKVARQVAVTKDGTKVSVQIIGEKRAKEAIRAAGFTPEEQIVEVMCVGIFCGMTLIHHDVSPYEHGDYPFVQYLYDRDKTGVPFGWVSRDIMTLQDAHNKRHSKAMHLLNTRQVIMTENAVRDTEETVEQVAKPDGVIILEQGRKIEDVFQIKENTELGQGQLAMYSHVRQAFEDAGQISQVAQGQAPGEVRSDRGLQRLEANATALDADVFRHIKAARRKGLLIQTSNIQQFFTDDMIVQITDDPNTVKVVNISRGDLSRLRRFFVNLVLIEENDYATSRQQQLDMLSQTLPQVLQFGPGWASLLISMTDLRDKESLMQQVASMAQPPQPEPRMSVSVNWADLPIAERIMWAVKLGFPQELIQLIQQGAVPSRTELSVQNDQAKQQSKERMEERRLDLKSLELEAKDSHVVSQRRLDALTSAAQEETKRQVANMQSAMTRGAQDVE